MWGYFRFRYRRSLRRWRRDVRILRQWAVRYLERHIWGKWYQLWLVRRFLVVWCAVMLVGLAGTWQQYHQVRRAAQVVAAEPGGTYTEAAVGSLTTLNPLLPENDTSASINRLLFSGLTQYNGRRQLVSDLADHWTVSPDGRTYTFTLRHGVTWHDGVPFTAGDVAFTIAAIQNPDSRSPLAASWQGVKVSTHDDYTVVFTLPSPLASFLDSTTLGIVPRHLLESVEPTQLREASFNRRPIGTGPFRLSTFAPSAHEVELVANPAYYAGRPKLDGFMFRLYDTPQAALTAYAQHQVSSPGQLQPENADALGRVAGLADYAMSLPEEATLFFANGEARLKDAKLRSILSRSLDRAAVAAAATGDQGVAVAQPLLPGQLGYSATTAPARLSPAATRAALDAAGYTLGGGGVRRGSDGRPLSFTLTTLNDRQLVAAAGEVKRQWQALGVELTVAPHELADLQQTYMRPRNFQMLLFGVNVGADPDVYAYWHSSQAKDPGVNLSGYASIEADRALEAGRIKTDPEVRRAKYAAFLAAWNADAPAAVLYQTVYHYAASADAAGITARRLVTPADRYFGVQDWTIRYHLADR